MINPKLTIGSRGSDLALYQANFIRDILTSQHGCDVDIRIIKTAGDKIDNVSFERMEGKGFFTKELEDALLAREIDLAVHSLKDLMTTQPDGLKLGAVGYRVNRHELLLINPGAHSETGVLPVKPGSVIGTSAARRKAQIAFYNPKLKIEDLRGNVPTRVAKLRKGDYTAILIAAAGAERLKLDLTGIVAVPLDPQVFLPAPAQGILGIQTRTGDPRVERVVSRLGSPEEAAAAQLERGLLAMFDSGCSLPLGVYSEKRGDNYCLKAVLGVRAGDGWAGLRRTEVTGDDIPTLIAEAYSRLQEAAVCRA
jgi:hydroxymethylbilane synthase